MTIEKNFSSIGTRCRVLDPDIIEVGNIGLKSTIGPPDYHSSQA